MRNRLDEKDYRDIAKENGFSTYTVKSVVRSFFSAIAKDAKSLPFNTPEKIYTHDGFDALITVWNIPYIGRLGPTYSKYRIWRKKEAKLITQVPRSKYRFRMTQSDFENIAAAILEGKAPPPLKKRKAKEMFNNVWIVGPDGKRLARQVIPKEE